MEIDRAIVLGVTEYGEVAVEGLDLDPFFRGPTSQPSRKYHFQKLTGSNGFRLFLPLQR